MTCDEIMKRDVECVSPGDTVEDAAARMRDANVGFLPICDQSRKVLGTLTDRDITIRLVAAGKPGSTLVEDVMTRDAVTCRPEDDIREAQVSMAEHEKSRIMCVDEEGRLAGVISLSDIAQHELGDRAAEILREVSEREART
jgi:CBS domain-containing protein